MSFFGLGPDLTSATPDASSGSGGLIGWVGSLFSGRTIGSSTTAAVSANAVLGGGLMQGVALTTMFDAAHLAGFISVPMQKALDIGWAAGALDRKLRNNGSGEALAVTGAITLIAYLCGDKAEMVLSNAIKSASPEAAPG